MVIGTRGEDVVRPDIVVAVAGDNGDTQAVNGVGMSKDGVEVVPDQTVGVVNVGWCTGMMIIVVMSIYIRSKNV